MDQVNYSFIVRRTFTYYFSLFFRQNQAVVHELIPDDITALLISGFNAKIPTTIYIHGFLQQGRNVNALRMRTRNYIKQLTGANVKV